MRTSDRKKLWALAGGRCSRCKKPHSDVKLEEAHIAAREADGPRGDVPLPAGERDGYANRILLCPTCHTTVDTDVEAWPVERLNQRKVEHEEWVQLRGDDVSELAGTVTVRAEGGDDVAGARIKKPTRIKPGTDISVDASGVRRVTGVEIGGNDE